MGGDQRLYLKAERVRNKSFCFFLEKTAIFCYFINMNKPIGEICIVEGLWCTGKSTICNYLDEKGYCYIKEPNYIKEKKNKNQPDSLTHWYVERHFENLEKGINLAKGGKDVVIERSPLSSLYFLDEDSTPTQQGCLQRLKDVIGKIPTEPWFVYLTPEDIESVVSCIGGEFHVSKFADSEILRQMDKILSRSVRDLDQVGLIELTEIKVSKQPLNKFKKVYE